MSPSKSRASNPHRCLTALALPLVVSALSALSLLGSALAPASALASPSLSCPADGYTATSSAQAVNPGATVTYTITFANCTSHAVSELDWYLEPSIIGEGETLEAVSFVGTAPSGAAAFDHEGTATWEVPDLAPGQTVVGQATLKVGEEVTGSWPTGLTISGAAPLGASSEYEQVSLPLTIEVTPSEALEAEQAECQEAEEAEVEEPSCPTASTQSSEHSGSSAHSSTKPGSGASSKSGSRSAGRSGASGTSAGTSRKDGLCVKVSADKREVRVGGLVRWTASVKDCGKAPIAGIHLTAPLAGCAMKAVSLGKGKLVNGSELSWLVAKLKPGQGKAFHVTTRLEQAGCSLPVAGSRLPFELSAAVAGEKVVGAQATVLVTKRHK
jgi:hypothetical protein